MTPEESVSAAMAKYSAGDVEGAAELLRAAIAEHPSADTSAALCHYHLGTIYWSGGRAEDAIACFERARSLDPAIADLPYQRGLDCAREGDFADAEMWFQLALGFDSNHALALLRLGDVTRKLGRVEESLPLLERAVELAPKSWEAHCDFALALCEAGHLDEAASTLEKAMRLRGSDAAMTTNLAVIRRSQGRIEDAIRLLDDAIRIAPNFSEAHQNRAFALLLARRFDEGWREYEWRPKKPLPLDRSLEAHIRAGLPLDGKSVLLHEEQGLGDLIQFVRYASPLEQMGAKVTIACKESLHPLIGSASGVADVVPSDDSLPPFDLCAPLLSMPRILHPATASLPVEIPYLRADPQRVMAWSERLQNEQRLRVGLVWGGSPGTSYDRRRSLPLAQLAAVLRNPLVAFYSLQRGPRMAELTQLDPGLTVVNLEEHCDGIMDTATAMMSLDLVISVDSMPAHLAGALGKPVWLLLPFAPDWRWMLDREDTVWYPSTRLFRQSSPGDWSDVVDRVAAALSKERSQALAQ